MENFVGSLFSGFFKAVGKLFGNPLDFLSGKSCSSVCGSTWDLMCYIENFCIANLLKLATASALLYIVLLFFYMLYKLGICKCICRGVCRMVWACFAFCFYILECFCNFLCYKLPKLKRRHQRRRRRRRRGRDIEELGISTSSSSSGEGGELESYSFHVPTHIKDRRSVSHRGRDYKGDHLRRSLRPRSHRVCVGIKRDNSTHLMNRKNRIDHVDDLDSSIHNIRVTRTSKFVKKGANYEGSVRGRRKRIAYA